MNIFHKVTLQSMKKSRARTMVTVVGVVLSAAMITAVATFAVSLLDYMVSGSAHKYGGWHVAFWDVDSAFVQARMNDGEAADTTVFASIGYAPLAGGENPDKPYLYVAAFSEEAFDALPVTLLSGRLPQNSGEILVPAHVSANGGVTYAVGDTLSLAVGNRMSGGSPLTQHDPYRAGERYVPQGENTYTVVGLCMRPTFEEYSAPGYTLITAADPADPSDSFSVFVTLKHPRRVQAYAADAAGTHGYALNDNVLRFLGLSDDIAFRVLLYAVGGILIALIVTGSVLMIYNAFTISLNERTRQFGILSSVGATQRQLCGSVLFEGLCIGAVGIPIGVLVGIGSTALIIPAVAGQFGTFAYSDVPFTLSVSAAAVAAAAAVSLLTILISAYIPARKAAGAPVMETIRQTDAVKIQPGDVKTATVVQKVAGLEGTLALKNFGRNRKRYRSIVLSLVLSIVLFVSANAFGADLKQASEQSAVEMDGDILLRTRDLEESELFRLYGELKTAQAVTQSTYQAILNYHCQVNPGDLTSAFREAYQASSGLDGTGETVDLKLAIQFIADDIYWDFIADLGLPAAEYTGPDAKMIVVGKQAGGVDLFAGRSMDIAFGPAPGERANTIHATFVDTYPLDPPPADPSEITRYVLMAIAPYRMKPQFDSLGAPTTFGLTFLSENPAQSAAEMERMIGDAGISSAYTLYNVHKILEDNRSIIFVVNVFSAVFVVMISLIAVANVFNTISTNIGLRRRELAMLRSVGMSERDLNRMMNFECVLYGARALLFGLPAAGTASWLIYRGLVRGGADIGFTPPWSSIAISVFGVFLVVCITMQYALHRVRRENIIEALRDDMT